MNSLQVKKGFIKFDPPNRKVNQDNAKHDAENKFLIHEDAEPGPCFI
jgi:hypothetical protein